MLMSPMPDGPEGTLDAQQVEPHAIVAHLDRDLARRPSDKAHQHASKPGRA